MITIAIATIATIATIASGRTTSAARAPLEVPAIVICDMSPWILSAVGVVTWQR